jgi:hypothetical protein
MLCSFGFLPYTVAHIISGYAHPIYKVYMQYLVSITVLTGLEVPVMAIVNAEDWLELYFLSGCSATVGHVYTP